MAVEQQGPREGLLVLHGRYELHERISQSEFSQSYRGFDRQSQTPVFVKTAEPLHERAAALLEREAILLAQLRSRWAVKVLDRFVEDGRTYLVLEYVHGGTLEQWRTQSRTLGDVVKLFNLLAQGLQEIHDAGIVHRDLKPSNIIISSDGRPRFVDFGLAVSRGELDTLTSQSTTIVGTPTYMPAEVLTGCEPLTGAADMYAFGVMLYEAVAGRPFREADSIRDFFEQTLRGGFNREALPEDVPPRLVELIALLVDVDPTRRPTAAEVIEGLQLPLPADSDSQVELPPPRPSPVVPVAVTSERRVMDPVRRAAPRPAWRLPRIELETGGALLLAGGVLAVFVYLVLFWWPLALALLLCTTGLSLLALGLRNRPGGHLVDRRGDRSPRELEVRLAAIEQRLADMRTVSDSLAIDLGGLQKQLAADRMHDLIRSSVLIALAEFNTGSPSSDVGRALEVIRQLLSGQSKTTPRAEAPRWYQRFAASLTAAGTLVTLAGSLVALFVTIDLWRPNAPPEIRGFGDGTLRARRGTPLELRVDAHDPNGDSLKYSYEASHGTIESAGPAVMWSADTTVVTNLVQLTVHVSDGKRTATAIRSIRINMPPELELQVPAQCAPGDRIRLSADARDADGDELTYAWQTSLGTPEENQPVAFLEVPDQVSAIEVQCRVSDRWDTAVQVQRVQVVRRR